MFAADKIIVLGGFKNKYWRDTANFHWSKKYLKSRFLEYVVALQRAKQGEKSWEDKEINFCSSKKA